MRTSTPLVALLAFACTAPPEHRSADGSVSSDTPLDLGALHRLSSSALTFVDRPVVRGLEPSWQARGGLARVYANERGLVVADRRHADPEWSVGLELTGWGRGERRTAPGVASIWAEDGVFEATHDGVVEVLEQQDDAIEHRFRLLRDPGGAEPVELDLQVSGARPYALNDGAAFVVKGRARVDWRGLLVRDHRGRTLDAYTEVDEDVLRVVIDAEGAEWPLEVDPMLTVFEAAVRPRSGVGSGNTRFGWSISGDGDRLLVGDPGSDLRTDGAGVVVERNTGGEDAWGDEAELRSGSHAHVGRAVGMEGLTAVVASDEAETVWVYRLDPQGWTREQTYTEPTVAEYGASVAIAADGIYVGSPGYARGISDVGKVFAYWRLFDGIWEFPSEWPNSRGRFGESIASSGELVLVGAPGVGGVALFSINRLLPLGAPWSETVAGTDLGASVAIAGDVAAASAPSVHAVRTYRRRPGTDHLEVTGVLSAPSTTAGGFGDRIAMTSDTLAVLDRPAQGMSLVHLYERRADDVWEWVEWFEAGVGDTPLSVTLQSDVLAVGVPDEGVVHVWRRSGTGWSEQVETGTGSAQFGSSVAVSGDLVAVGAKNSDVGASNAGMVSLFRRDAPGVWSFVGDQISHTAGEHYGTAVDVENDALVVGAPDAPNGGRVDALMFDGLDFVPSTRPPVARYPWAGFGRSVSLEQNLLLVGDATWYGNGNVEVFYQQKGSAREYNYESKRMAAYGFDFGDHMGLAVAVWSDWMFSSSGDANGGRGQVHVRQYPDTIRDIDPATPPILLEGGVGEGLGSALSADGGVLAVGGPGASRVRLYALTPTNTWTQVRTLTGTSDFGASVALRGDDLFVGAPSAQLVEHRRRNQGGTDTWGLVESWSGTANQRFGATLAFEGTALVIGEPGAASDQGTVHLIELGADLSPLGEEETYILAEDTHLGVAAPGVLENDHDPMGGALTASIVTPPAHAKAFQLRGDGGFDYQPSDDFYGADGFVYAAHNTAGAEPTDVTVTIGVTPVNDLPVALDDHFAGFEDVRLDSGRSVLDNDSDVESPLGDLTPVVVDAPVTGLLNLQSDGTFTYFPADDQFGVVTFTYEVHDPEGASSPPATVTIDLAPTNDPPIVRLSSFQLSMDEDGRWLGSHDGGLLNPQIVVDPDGDPLAAALDTPATRGSVRVEADGSWSYVPAPDVTGQDSFTYVVSDGTTTSSPITVNLLILPVNDPPTAVADGPYQTLEDTPLHLDGRTLVDNDLDPDSVSLTAILQPSPAPQLGTVTFDPLTNDFIYFPNRDASGTDVFWYRVSDGDSESDPVRVIVQVVPVNDAPVAVDDDAGEVRSRVSGAVLENDHDVEGDALNAELVAAPLGGVVVLQPDGTFTYTAQEGFVGADGFRYVARDGAGASSAPALVSLVVLPSGDTTTGPTDTGCQELEWFADADGDGFGDPEIAVRGCDAPPSHVLDDTDCDDTRAGSHPGAEEIQGDGLDQDCDGLDNGLRTAGACDTAPGGRSALGLALLALGAARRRRGTARPVGT